MLERKESWVSRRIAALEASSTSSTPTSSAGKPSASQQGRPCQDISSSVNQDIVSSKLSREHCAAAHEDMPARIAELELALAASERRVVYLSSSAANDAASDQSRDGDKTIAAVERYCAQRVCQLQDALVQAEKRANWLQGELKVAWACSAQRVRELEDVVDRPQAGGNDGLVSGQSRGGAPRAIFDKCKMDETLQALGDLRKKFYRTMRERDRLKSTCDRQEQELSKIKPHGARNTNNSREHGKPVTRKNNTKIAQPNLERAPESTVDVGCSWRWSPPV